MPYHLIIRTAGVALIAQRKHQRPPMAFSASAYRLAAAAAGANASTAAAAATISSRTQYQGLLLLLPRCCRRW